MSKKSTRQAYGEALVELGRINNDIVVLDADLSKSTKTDLFKKEFPKRHLNIGIAEADLIGTAAGFAACGKIPFASTFAMFAAGRAFEQILSALAKARECKGKPTMIIAKTIKGKGVSFMENVCGFHGVAPTLEELERALAELA